MNARIEELDRLIDALNEQREPAEIEAVDDDLVELLDLARGLQTLGQTQWPDGSFPARAAINISAKLAPAPAGLNQRDHILDGETGDLSRLPPLPVIDDAPRPVPLPTRRAWLRKSLEIAAAIVVLVAFTGLVSILLRGGSSGSPTSTAQVGQSSSTGSLAALDDIFPMVKAVNEAGNGRYLGSVKSDSGITVTLMWAGSTSNRVLVAMMITQLDEFGDFSPSQVTLRTADGADLTYKDISCKQPVCLVQFDRVPIENRSGEIPLHLGIQGLHSGSSANTSNNVGTPDVAASFAFDFSIPAWSNGEATAPNIPTPVVTLGSGDSASVPETVSNPTLSALQQAAGFGLYAPAELPDGLALAQPKPPMSLPGFASVVLKYVDASGKEALTITEASPYQDSAQTMPADVWNNASSVEIQSVGYGHVSARIYQSDGDVQLWWQVGPTSIRLESGGAQGTTVLTEKQLLDIALWMVPVSTTDVSAPEIPSDATVQTSDQAVAKVRAVISSLGGNVQSPASKVSLVRLSEEIALGLPEPTTIDPTAPVWVVQFDNGLSPQECPANWVSVCNGGQLVAVVDAASGDIIGFRGGNGSWQ